MMQHDRNARAGGRRIGGQYSLARKELRDSLSHLRFIRRKLNLSVAIRTRWMWKAPETRKRSHAAFRRENAQDCANCLAQRNDEGAIQLLQLVN